MKFTPDSFITGVVAIAVACVVLSAVAIPIINEAVGEQTGAMADILGILPVFIAIGILMACVTLFISRKG